MKSEDYEKTIWGDLFLYAILISFAVIQLSLDTINGSLKMMIQLM